MGRILSIDPGVSRPGFAVMELDKVIHFSSCKTKFSGPPRWLEILNHFERILKVHTDISFCVIEGYAFGSFELSTMGEIGGLLRWKLFINEIPYGDVAPNTLKKFWTGNGHAKKSEMMAEAERRGYSVSDPDQADAIALAHYGYAHGFDGLKNTWPSSSLGPNKKKSK